jgi:hypothetical protein
MTARFAIFLAGNLSQDGGAMIQVVAVRLEGGVRAVYMTNNPDKLSCGSLTEVQWVP